MDEKTSKHQVRALVQNEMSKSLTRLDPDFGKVARVANFPRVARARLAACIGAAVNDQDSIPLIYRLMDRSQKLEGMAQRLGGFSEVPLIGIGGEDDEPKKKRKGFTPKTVSFVD